MKRRRPEPTTSRERQHWWALPSLLAITFIIKATALVQLGNHPLLQAHGELDTAYYLEIARKVASGGPLAISEPFFVSPLYVYALAVVFRLGGSIFVAQVLQILLGTAAIGLLFATARFWFGVRAAWVAAGLAVLTGLFTFYEILILQAALDPFLVALSLYLVSRASTAHRPGYLAAAGVAAGVLVLNRPNALAYVACAGVALAAVSWARRVGSAPARAAGRALVFPAALLLVLVPNLARNYAVSGEWILISSHGGLNFYIGNNERADGIYTPVPGVSASMASQARDARRVAEQAAGRELSAGEVSDYFYGRAWSWIASRPGAATRLFARKLALLTNRVEIPLNFSYAYYRRESSVLRVLVAGSWLLVPLGLVGLFVPSARQTRRGYWVWASFVPIYGLSVAAFFVTDRYRLPLLVPLCASSGAFVSWGWQQVRARRLVPVAGPAVATAVLFTLANWPLGLDDGRGFEQTRWATWLVEQGRYADARAYVERIGPAHSHPGVLHYRVGQALADASRFEDAVGQFEKALAIDRGQAAIELELGQALTVAGHPAEAVPHLTAALDAGHRTEVASPWLVRALAAAGEKQRATDLIAQLPDTVAAARPETAVDLGTMALELDAPVVADRWLRLAVAAEPARAEPHEKLGVALIMQRRPDEAVAPLETACRLDPSSASANLNLAVAYAQTGRADDARAHAERARQLDPNESRAEALLRALIGK